MNLIPISMMQLRSVLVANIRTKTPTMIWGKPGVGKSTLVHDVADQLRGGFVDFRATLRDPVDVRGLPMVDQKTGTSKWLPPHELPQEKRDGKTGVLLIDELPQAGDAMQKALFSLVLDRRIGDYELPRGWAVVAAGNRTTDRSGASRLNMALANRFAHFEVDVDIKSWCTWALGADLDFLVVAFLRFRPEYLHKFPENSSYAYPTPRSWEMAAKHVGEKDDDLRLQLIQGLVGQAAATEFQAFLYQYRSLPTMEQIFANPRGAICPPDHEPATLTAVTAGIAKRVTKETMTAALTYVERLPVEHQVAFVDMATTRDPSLKDVKAFGSWIIKHKDLLT